MEKMWTLTWLDFIEKSLDLDSKNELLIANFGPP
jgi:hypothetical protein